MLIRRFEERTYQEYTKPGQKIGGFCHLYSGQEAIAVGTAALFDKNRDYLVTGYRCHGHSLALGMSPRSGYGRTVRQSHRLLQGQGRIDAPVRSRRRQHRAAMASSAGRFRWALGMAFAQWYKKTGGVTFTFMGDGAINQGTHNEALNLASL